MARLWHTVEMNQSNRLVSRGELARRLTCSRALVYRHTEPGKRMGNAVIEGMVDLNHPDAAKFCAQYGYQEPDGASIAAAARVATVKQVAAAALSPPASTPAPSVGRSVPVVAVDNEFEDGKSDEERTANEFMDMSLRELVGRYGTQSQFKNVTAAVKNLIQMRGYEEEQARKRGEYIHRVHAERLIAMVDGLQKALLTDAVSNMSNKAAVQIRAGAEKTEIEGAMRDTISRTIKLSKSQIVRSLRDI